MRRKAREEHTWWRRRRRRKEREEEEEEEEEEESITLHRLSLVESTGRGPTSAAINGLRRSAVGSGGRRLRLELFRSESREHDVDAFDHG